MVCAALIWRSYALLMSHLSVYDIVAGFLTVPEAPRSLKSLAFNLARTQKKHLNLESIYPDMVVGGPDFLCSSSLYRDKRTIRNEVIEHYGSDVCQDKLHIQGVTKE